MSSNRFSVSVLSARQAAQHRARPLYSQGAVLCRVPYYHDEAAQVLSAVPVALAGDEPSAAALFVKKIDQQSPAHSSLLLVMPEGEDASRAFSPSQIGLAGAVLAGTAALVVLWPPTGGLASVLSFAGTALGASAVAYVAGREVARRLGLSHPGVDLHQRSEPDGLEETRLLASERSAERRLYRHVEIGYVSLGLLALIAGPIFAGALTQGAPQSAGMVAGGAGCMGFFLYSMTIEVYPDAVRLHFGPGLWERVVAIDAIDRAEPSRDWRPIWGAPLIRGDAVAPAPIYRVSGTRVLKLEVGQGGARTQTVTIGTRHPEELKQAIGRARQQGG